MMLLNRRNDGLTQVVRQSSLQTVLIILFTLQILATVGLVGYFSLRNGQQTVNALSGQMQREMTHRIEEIESDIKVPHTLNSFKAIALMQGDIHVGRGEGSYPSWQQAKLVLLASPSVKSLDEVNLIVTALPEAILIESPTTDVTLWSCLMALVGVANILTAGWIVRSIVRLSTSATAQGKDTLDQQVARTAALQASEEKFASAFCASPIAMSILTLADGKYIDVNNSFCRAMGYDREQVIGQSCMDLNLWKYPEEFARVFKIIEKNCSIRDQEVAFCQQSGETLMIKLSGEVINLSEMSCVLLTYEDVTERKQAEEALHRSEQELRLITDALPACICYVDREKRYQFVNRTYEDWFGWRRDEILGKHYREVLGEEVYQIIKPHSERTLAGAVTTYEAEMPYLLGTKYISATLLPDVDDRGQVKGYYGLISDISDRKRAEAASVLEERNRMAREIHDTLAQALTSIIIHLEAASLRLPTDIESAQSLIQTGRDLARSGLAEARRSVEALRPLILENCDLYTALKEFAEQMFSCTDTQVSCDRFGYPYPLESSVENNVFRIGQEALHNVLKHAKASEIKLELVYERSCFTLRITDNGQGFTVDHHAVGKFGLLGMTERAERMGASFIIQSGLGHGTTIILSVDQRNL